MRRSANAHAPAASGQPVCSLTLMNRSGLQMKAFSAVFRAVQSDGECSLARRRQHRRRLQTGHSSHFTCFPRRSLSGEDTHCVAVIQLVAGRSMHHAQRNLSASLAGMLFTHKAPAGTGPGIRILHIKIRQLVMLYPTFVPFSFASASASASTCLYLPQLLPAPPILMAFHHSFVLPIG